MPSMNYSLTAAAAGVSIQQTISRSADGGDGREIDLPAGKAGTLSTRTDNDTGVLTVASGHGITTSDKVDVYWNGGCHYGMTVTATTSTTISIDVGAGDNLPVATTAIVVCKQTQVNLMIDGDLLAMIGINQKYADPTVTANSHIDLQDGSNTTVTAMVLHANSPQVYDVAGGSSNPFTGNIILRAMASNGSSTTAAKLQIAWVVDSTP